MSPTGLNCCRCVSAGRFSHLRAGLPWEAGPAMGEATPKQLLDAKIVELRDQVARSWCGAGAADVSGWCFAGVGPVDDEDDPAEHG